MPDEHRRFSILKSAVFVLVLASAPARAQTTARAHSTIDPKDAAIAKKLGFKTTGSDTPVTTYGSWSSGPVYLLATFDFLVPPDIRPLGPGMHPLAGKRDPGGSGLMLYSVGVPMQKDQHEATLTFIDQKGSVTAIHLLVGLRTHEPVVEVDPSCAGAGIKAQAETAAPQESPSAIFVRCARHGAKLTVEADSWETTAWSAVPAAKEGTWQLEPGAHSVKGELPLYPAGGETQKFRLELVGAKDRKPAATVTITHSELRAQSWHIYAGIGPTWSSYSESAPGLPDVKVSQLGMTVKSMAQFVLFPPKWDAAFSVFGTALPLTNSPSSLPSARWLGINLRLGLRLNLDEQGRNTIAILPGIYAWSMFVSGNQYGVQNLNGPQLVISANHQQGTRLGRFGTVLGVGGYVKYAAMASGLQLTGLGNREIAAGGQVVVRFFSVPRPLVFAVDLSNLDFASDGFTMTLSTASLSVGCSLY